MSKNLALLSKRDIIFLLDLINSSCSCNSEGQLRRLMTKMKHLVPFDYAICGLASITDTGNVSSYNLINISYPDEWLLRYVEKKYHQIDPIVKDNFTCFRLQYWKDTFKKNISSKAFISEAREYGLSKGYTYGERNYQLSEGSLFSFAGSSIEHNQRTEVVLKYIMPHLHRATTRIIGKSNSCRATLTPREKEVLKWIREGKSTWDISLILGISENTIKFHVKTILQKLDAVSRVQAVAIAIEQGLIEFN